MSKTIKKVDNISLGLSEKDLKKIIGLAQTTKKVSDSITLLVYKRHRVWLNNGIVVQISLYGKTTAKIGSLQLGKTAPESDNEMGTKYYSSNDEVWKYSKYPNVCFTLDKDCVVNEIFIFKI